LSLKKGAPPTPLIEFCELMLTLPLITLIKKGVILSVCMFYKKEFF
jgi:hypothetical protein